MFILQTTFISSYPTSQELHYCRFAVKLDRFVRSCNTLHDLSNKLCVPNQTEDLNLKCVQHYYRNK